jgi:hypothetical protein
MCAKTFRAPFGSLFAQIFSSRFFATEFRYRRWKLLEAPPGTMPAAQRSKNVATWI